MLTFIVIVSFDGLTRNDHKTNDTHPAMDAVIRSRGVRVG